MEMGALERLVEKVNLFIGVVILLLWLLKLISDLSIALEIYYSITLAPVALPPGPFAQAYWE